MIRKHLQIVMVFFVVFNSCAQDSKTELRDYQKEIQKAFDIIFRIQNEEAIIVYPNIDKDERGRIENFYLKTLPIPQNQPYSPWKKQFHAPENMMYITWNNDSTRILKMRSQVFRGNFKYDDFGKIIYIDGLGLETKKEGKSIIENEFYDIIYNNEGLVSEIKGYLKTITELDSMEYDTTLFQKISKKYSYNIEGELVEYSYWKKCSDNLDSRLCRNELTQINYNGNIEQVTFEDKEYGKKHQYNYTYDSKGNLKQIDFKDLLRNNEWTDKLRLDKNSFVLDYIRYEGGKINSNCISYQYISKPDWSAKYDYLMLKKKYNENEECIFEYNMTTRKSREKVDDNWTEWK